MKKRIFTALLALAVTANCLALTGCGQKQEEISKEDTSEYVTRGEWIAMLAEGFGLEGDPSGTPYYTDVTAESEWFPSVQTTAQWGILSIYADDKLEPDKPVTYAEMASTAAIAAGFKEGNSRGDGADRFDPQPSVDYATQYKIISPGLDADQPMTMADCEAVLAAAQEVYIENPGEEKLEVVPNPERVDLSGIPLETIQITGDIASFPGTAVEEWGRDANGGLTVTLRTDNGTRTLGVGTTFITAPSDQALFGTAYKVDSLEELADGGVALTTTTPMLGDLYNDVDIHTTVTTKDAIITWADGVTATLDANQRSETGQSYQIELLAVSAEPLQEDVPSDSVLIFPFSLPLRGAPPVRTGTANSMPQSEARNVLQNSSFVYSDTPDIKDFGGSTKSWEKKLKKEEKYDKDFKITGSISVDIQITTEIEYHKFLGIDVIFWPETANVSVKSDVIASLNFEGTLAGELEIGHISIPLGVTGFSVDGRIFLYAEANGSLNLRVEFINDYGTTWHNPGGFANVVSKKEVIPEVEAALDLSAGVGVGLSLCAFEIKIIGTDLKVGGDLEATASVVGNCKETTQNDVTMRTYTEALKVTTNFYIPIISLTISGPEDLSDILGLEKTFEIVGKDKAKKINLLNKEYVFWTETIELDAEGNIILPPGPLGGDFSEFAGRYRADPDMVEANSAGGVLAVSYPDFILHEDGSITGGGFTVLGRTDSFAGTAPISVVKGEESGNWPPLGTYECTVKYTPPSGNEPTFDGYEESYILSPAEVTESGQVEISYSIATGGVAVMRYYKVDTDEGGPLEGDFSKYAGTYRVDPDFIEISHGIIGEPYGEYEYPDLVLHEDGSITGGGLILNGRESGFLGSAPISVWEETGGYYACTVSDGNYGNYEAYNLYPVGTAQNNEDTSQPRILYNIYFYNAMNYPVQTFYMLYTKID